MLLHVIIGLFYPNNKACPFLIPITKTGVVNKANVKMCQSLKNALWLILMIFSCSFWTQSTSSLRSKILEHYPGVLKTCQSLKNGLWWMRMVFCCSFWTQLASSPRANILERYPGVLKSCQSLKMVFDGCAWFSLVLFEPSWQASPGQRSLNITPESWKPVSNWKNAIWWMHMVFPYSFLTQFAGYCIFGRFGHE